MRLAGRLLLLSLLATPATASASVPRWPSWPSAVSRDAAPLLDPEHATHDRDRTAAVYRLQRYPTPLIEDALVETLSSDPSAQVVREALRVCYLRRAVACLEPAATLYKEERTDTLRAPALRVLALDPHGERLDLLLEAMLAPSDNLRAEAAQLAGWAPLQGDALARTRRALLAKLSDTSSAVRERAVTSLGLQGPGDGTLAIARLLEDAEPDVRAAAAVALGRLEDPKATAALRRALEGQNEGNVTRAMLTALARLPGDDVAQTLLDYLDAPPPGVGTLTVADAIGDRQHPEQRLLDGLIERLRAPALEQAAGRALLLLGDAAAPALQAALTRGLGPRLDSELRTLLSAARPIESQPPTESDNPWPEGHALDAWQTRLDSGTPTDRLEAGAALGARAPAWLLPYVHGLLDRHPLEVVRPWLVAFASLPEPVAFRDDSLSPWGTLSAWALDTRRAGSDRCLAALALGRARGRQASRLAIATFDRLQVDPSAGLRACVAWASRTVSPSHTARGLLDPDPRARAAAAAASAAHPSASVQARRRHLAATDPDGHVRRACTSRTAGSALRFTFRRPAEAPWSRPALFDDAHVILGTLPTPWFVDDASAERHDKSR